MPKRKQNGQLGERRELPPGVELVHALEGHAGIVYSLTFDPVGKALASGSSDGTVKLWDVSIGKLLRTLEGDDNYIRSVEFAPEGETLASGGYDKTVKLWEVTSGKLLRTLEAHKDSINSVKFDPAGRTLASGSDDKTVKLWRSDNGRLLRTLEGHTGSVDAVAFSPDGQILASKSKDGTLRLWSCKSWDTVAVILEPTHPVLRTSGLAFHPVLPLLATVGSETDAPEHKQSRRIHLYKLDIDLLLGKASETKQMTQAVHQTASGWTNCCGG